MWLSFESKLYVRSLQAATTLFIMPTTAAGDWDHFMTHIHPLADSYIAEKEYEGYIQIVPFHPLAEFSDVDQVRGVMEV